MTPLANRMRALADKRQDRGAQQLRDAADALDRAAADADTTAPRLLSAWARACRIFAEQGDATG